MCTQDDELSVKLHLYLVQNYYKSLMTYILFLIGSWWDITNIQHRFVIPVDISQLPEDEPSDPLGTDVLRSSSPSSKWLHTVTEAMERVCFVRLFVLMCYTIGSLHTGFYFENCSDSLCRSCVWPPVGLDLWNLMQIPRFLGMFSPRSRVKVRFARWHHEHRPEWPPWAVWATSQPRDPLIPPGNFL